MKTNLEKNMEKILNLSETTPMAEIISNSNPVVEKPETTNDDIADDYAYARKNLTDIIDTAQGAINNMADIASISESPRAYEVLSTLIKTVVDANQSLLVLQKQLKELKGTEKKPNPDVVNNTMFIGSTADLQKALNQLKQTT